MRYYTFFLQMLILLPFTLFAQNMNEIKLTVLVDNNTLIDRYFIGEPGVSYLIEADGKKILFDVGYSDTFIANSRKMNINLLDVDVVVLSHGHLDHTWGLDPFIKLYNECIIESRDIKKPMLLTHPLALSSKMVDNSMEIGSLFKEDILSKFFKVKLSEEPIFLTERLVYLGEIERTNDFEAKSPIGKTIDKGIEKDDFLFDDSALAFKSSKGLIIITGCSHAGICNIVEHAKKVCNDDRIVDIIGGFHLLNPTKKQMQGTIDYMESLNLNTMHPCHCTDLQSKIKLSEVVGIKEVGVGLTIEY
jgi:7,8-dihydropterin-6-yl-methyl-4-(beta-D-ribofuranosyl)aminobenzene 5'-phosphate synthase